MVPLLTMCLRFERVFIARPAVGGGILPPRFRWSCGGSRRERRQAAKVVGRSFGRSVATRRHCGSSVSTEAGTPRCSRTGTASGGDRLVARRARTHSPSLPYHLLLLLLRHLFHLRPSLISLFRWFNTALFCLGFPGESTDERDTHRPSLRLLSSRCRWRGRCTDKTFIGETPLSPRRLCAS